jgi:molybdopterin converting factor subunit 1
MMQVTVLFFATLKECTGVKQTTLELPQGARVADLKAGLLASYPTLESIIGSAVVALNRQFAFDQDVIPEGAEAALFPPVSGGASLTPDKEGEPPTIFAITEAELDLNDLLERITLASSGAAAIFTGMVRGVTTRDDPHQTQYLEYEAYIPMAEAKMRQVAEEMRQRWPSLQGIAMVQRIGRLYPRTPTVFIACTAAHRDTGVFEAARYGIDRLKEIVPIWKKEVGPGGEEWVEGKYFPRPQD